MKNVYVLTYATHSHGLFDELINNKFNINVIVLGFNTKWNGFLDKFKGVYNFLKNKDDNDLIIFLDGFDSMINKPLDEIIKRFQKMNCRVLFSKEQIHNKQSNVLMKIIFKYLIKKTFGTCKDGLTANTGLYMGYVKDIRNILYNLLNFKLDRCKADDQRQLNYLCKSFESIKIDHDNKIFMNCPNYTNCKNNDTCLIQYPGKISLTRIKRAIPEYSCIFRIDFILILIIIYFFILRK